MSSRKSKPDGEPQRRRFLTRSQISEYLRKEFGIHLGVEALRQRDHRGQGPEAAYLGRSRVSTPEQIDRWVSTELLRPIPRKASS